jgi:hypothetical protein
MSRAALFGTAPTTSHRQPPVSVIVQIETEAGAGRAGSHCRRGRRRRAVHGPGRPVGLDGPGRPDHAPQVMKAMADAAQRCHAVGKPMGTIGVDARGGGAIPRHGLRLHRRRLRHRPGMPSRPCARPPASTRTTWRPAPTRLRILSRPPHRMAAVELRGVTKSYDGANPCMHGIDLDIQHGEFTVFVGPSGCGKSTLLRMHRRAGGDQRRRSAHRRQAGATTSRRALRDIAMVFQDYALYPHKTLFENMAFGLRLRKTPEAEIQPRVGDAAELLKIDAHAGTQAARAVGWPAPARGHRPRHRAPTAGVPVRRAAVEPRRPAAAGDAQRDQAPAPAAGRHHHLCHARPDRGDDAGRPHRRAARWPCDAVRPAAQHLPPPGG